MTIDGDQGPMGHPSDGFSEPPRELPGETTLVDVRDRAPDERTQILSESEPMPTLVVEAGRDRGREFVLVPGETTVGRGMDNEVILSDLSVSRRHLYIVRDGQNLTLRDSGSGNGTLVNGQRVQVQALTVGDRIEIGETVLRLRAPSLAAGVEEDFTIPPFNTGGASRAVIETHAHIPPDDAVEHVTWSSPPPLRKHAIVIDWRVLIASGLGVALAASGLGALVVAITAREVPTPRMAEPRRAIVQAKAMPATERAESVAPAASPVELPPLSPHPSPPAVSQVGASASGHDPAIEPQPVEDRDDGWDRRGTRRRPRRSSRDTASREPVDLVVRAYGNEEFARASDAAREHGQAARALQIDQFAVHYRNAQTAPLGSNVSISALERAIAIDNQIVRGGRFGARLRQQLVGAYLEAAARTLATRPEDACRRVQLALRLEASDERALGLSRRCEAQADRLMRQARALERAEPARARSHYQSVLPMVAASSSLYAEARRRIEAISRAHSVDEDQ